MSDMEFVLTPNGFENVQNELTDLLTNKRPAIIERIRQARQLGDLSENFDYDDAKRGQAILESRIAELKAIISHASVVDEVSTDGSIGVGSRVTVKDLDEGVQDVYFIVGPAESNPAAGKISHESRVGEALMGKKTGDKVVVLAPSAAINYEIVSVE
ncbi:MAG: transcription elongation factor GreA [Armatimonadetes bacterium]|jgi:transcription elongation factor GreA|nr:transcription elongation factor GreA [Armatimonadota bacterium]